MPGILTPLSNLANSFQVMKIINLIHEKASDRTAVGAYILWRSYEEKPRDLIVNIQEVLAQDPGLIYEAIPNDNVLEMIRNFKND